MNAFTEAQIPKTHEQLREFLTKNTTAITQECVQDLLRITTERELMTSCGYKYDSWAGLYMKVTKD